MEEPMSAQDRAEHKGTATKNRWVQIHSILLSPEERSHKVPDATRSVPLEMWVNGFLVNDSASVGDEVEIETAIGRRVRGTLSDVRPGYSHSYGETLPELLEIGRQLRSLRTQGGES
jgi:2-amino-4-ketopentanoate thiolase alpha subunit